MPSKFQTIFELNPKIWIYVERLYIHCYNTKGFVAFLRSFGIEYTNQLYKKFRTTKVLYTFMSEENYTFARFMQNIDEDKQLEILQKIVFDGTLRNKKSDYFNYYGERIGKWYLKILRFIRLAGIKIDKNTGVLYLSSKSLRKPTSPIKVFLSYARQDEISARRLYRDLVIAGYKVWFDKKSLLPGQAWESEIKKAINDADSVIVMLSRQSKNKRGYYQKEIRLALDTFQKIPAGQIYLIPARLDNCEPPEHLSSSQWVDLFDDWQIGIRKLIDSLKVLRKSPKR